MGWYLILKEMAMVIQASPCTNKQSFTCVAMAGRRKWRYTPAATCANPASAERTEVTLYNMEPTSKVERSSGAVKAPGGTLLDVARTRKKMRRRRSSPKQTIACWTHAEEWDPCCRKLYCCANLAREMQLEQFSGSPEGDLLPPQNHPHGSALQESMLEKMKTGLIQSKLKGKAFQSCHGEE